MAKLILSLLLIAVSQCDALVRFSSPSVTADFGGAARLRCRADKPVEIYHKGTMLVAGGNYALQRRPNTDLTLTINKVSLEDIGKYTCKSDTESSDAQLQIRPYFPDDGKVYLKELGLRTVIPFNIYAVPRPDVKYEIKNPDGTYKTVAEIEPAGTMYVGADEYLVDANSGHFTILKAEKKHEGDYRVETTQLGVPKSAFFKLRVGIKPKILASPAPGYNFTSGETANFNCGFESSPKILKWKYTAKDGTVTEVTAASTGVMTLDGTNLKINPVAVEHEGAALECIGQNDFGNVSASTKIEVVYVKPVIKAMTDKEIAVGKEATITCESSGNPKPKVSWLKVNADNSTAKVTQTQSPGSSVFKISSATWTDAGTYKCEAVIMAKPTFNDRASLEVKVTSPPIIDDAISTKLVTFIVGKGESKKLVCAASGSPVPTITFTKGNKSISGAVEVTKGNKITSTLTHTANATSGAGTVKCVASSTAGKSSLDITVQVIAKPAVPTGLQASSIERTTIDLSWNAVPGAKSYRIKQFEKDVITVSGTTHSVKNLLAGKGYKFAVAGENMAGVGVFSAFLTVTTEKFDKPSTPSVAAKPSLKDPKLSWTKPAVGSDDPSLVYVVKYCTVADGKCMTETTNSTMLSLKLKEDTDYSIEITPRNSRGDGSTTKFQFKTGASVAPKPTTDAGPTDVPEPKKGKKKGLSGGAIAGIIIAVILILLIVIDLFCCFFNECGFSHCCYQTCCAGKDREGYTPAKEKDMEKAELKEVEGNDHGAETKTAPEEKEDASKEKKSEDV